MSDYTGQSAEAIYESLRRKEEAARAMLAALESIVGYVLDNGTHEEIDAVQYAIAQAEAAGIK